MVHDRLRRADEEVGGLQEPLQPVGEVVRPLSRSPRKSLNRSGCTGGRPGTDTGLNRDEWGGVEGTIGSERLLGFQAGDPGRGLGGRECGLPLPVSREVAVAHPVVVPAPVCVSVVQPLPPVVQAPEVRPEVVPTPTRPPAAGHLRRPGSWASRREGTSGRRGEREREDGGEEGRAGGPRVGVTRPARPRGPTLEEARRRSLGGEPARGDGPGTGDPAPPPAPRCGRSPTRPSPPDPNPSLP